VKVSYKTHIENEGWNIAVTDGQTSGTTGQSLRMEALIIELLEKGGLDIAIEAQAHVQDDGWQTPLRTDGEIIGTVGESKRLEALRIRLVGADAKKYSIKYRVHVQDIGWQLWKKDGETAGTTGVAMRAEAIEIMLERTADDVVVVVPNTPTTDPTQIIVPISDPNAAIPPEKILCASYATHVQNYGWGAEVTDGRLSGRVGQGLRMEAIRIALINTGSLNIGVAYQTHVENIGWQTEVANGQTAGTTDQSLRLEAVKMRLTGTDGETYSIWYRVHVQNEGWQEWCRDGEIAGTTGQALRAEAIQIIITLKTQSLIRTPGDAPLIAINYRAHIQDLAWAAWVKNGQKSGTTGLGLRMEAIEIKLSSLDGLDIGVKYRVHVQNIGWQDWFADGATAGTVGQSLRIEAIEIVLTGADAGKYTVQYRGHLEDTGWTTWKKNGETLGTTGQEIRLEAVSIVLIKNVDLNATITNEIKNKAPYLQIWASDFPRADVLLHDIRTEHRVMNPKVTAGINKSSGFTFTIDPTHENYNFLRKMHTTILIYEIYSNMNKNLVFEGRILTDDEDLNKMRSVTCEGELGYLLDSVQRPAKYINVTPEQWMTQVLDNHNMQVTSDKRLHMGICTVLGDGTGVVISTSYRSHIEDQAWLSWVKNGDLSGTTGSGLRMEAIELKLENIGGVDVGVTYRVHLAGTGWQDWKKDGETAGTTGQGIQMEAIEIKLTGADAGLYSIQYRVHVQDQGWQDWKQDGETAGTTGQALQAEAICIIIVSKIDGTNTKLKDSLFRENEYVNTLELIKTTMLDTLGGVLVIERIGGIKFLNYLENYGSVNSQPIRFGVNLIDYSKKTDASGIITALVPYGKEIDGKKLDISSVNDNCDYIYDEVAVAEHGWIFGKNEWADIDSASALMAAGKLYLAGKLKEGISLELTAVDLSMVNVDIQKFEVGDMVRCVSKPHDVDVFLSVSKKERDLMNPGNDRVVLGGVTESLTDRVSGPLGGGIMGFALETANSVQNMEYVSNELSFLVKLTDEKTDATQTQLNEAELKITPTAITATVRSSIEYIADQNSKANATDLGNLTSRVNTAEQKITADAIVSTVTSSSTYTNAMDGKVSTVNVISCINQTAEAITISASKLNLSGYTTFSQAQSLADTAKSGAVSTINSGLSGGTTTINGGCITTGTVNCKYLGGTLNFSGITCKNLLRIETGETTAQVDVKAANGKLGSMYANDQRGLTLESSGGGVAILPQDGSSILLGWNTVVSGTLTATNIPYTSTDSSQKITLIRWVGDYVEVSGPAGVKGITVWDSDRKLKSNIEDSTLNALEEIGKIKTRSFNWVKDGSFEACSFVAQEIEEAIGEKHVLKVKQNDGSTSYQIAEKGFIPLLVKATQELEAMQKENIARLEMEITLLKLQIAEIKGETTC
jgi:phage minor structural protein